jgi:OFA family oxalate/formate antiporter-like MFS transporter
MRYLIIPAALCMQICLGATYSWSVYVQEIKNLLHITQAAAQLPFSVFYFVFPATMIVSGTIMARIGPRAAAMIGGVLFGGGWIFSSFGSKTFALTVMGNGLIAGIGAGLAYIVPIATCIQWFPKYKGLVTGLAVAGFGGGAALVSTIGGHLLVGTRTPFDLFRYFGTAFLVLVVTAGFFMVPAPKSRTARPVEVRFAQVVRSRTFLLLYFAMFTGLAAGFAVNANIKELCTQATIAVGVASVALFAVANAAGRILWGMLFDRLEAKTVIEANLLFQALLLFAAPLALRSSAGLQLFALIAGFNYGGILVVYAGAVARIWSPERVARVYGWLFSANIPGAIAPLAAAWSYDHLGSFNLALGMIACLLLIGVTLVHCNAALFDEH